MASLCINIKNKVKSLSHVWLFETPWTVAYQVPPSMGFSREEYWILQIFPTQGLNLGLLHCGQTLYCLSNQGRLLFLMHWRFLNVSGILTRSIPLLAKNTDLWSSGTSHVALVVKNLLANAGDTREMGLIPWSGRFPGEEHGNALQYSCLKNPMDRGSWQATVHRVAKSWTQLKRLGMHTHGSRYSAFMGVEEYVLLLPALRKYFYSLRSDLEATESASLLQFFANFTFSPRKTTFSHLDVHNIAFRIMSFV